MRSIGGVGEGARNGYLILHRVYDRWEISEGFSVICSVWVTRLANMSDACKTCIPIVTLPLHIPSPHQPRYTS
jgi:hypothetical protein